MSESSVKKKSESANDFQEQYRKAAIKEKELRKLFQKADEGEIGAITAEALGELTMERTTLQDDYADQNGLLPDVVAGKLGTGNDE